MKLQSLQANRIEASRKKRLVTIRSFGFICFAHVLLVPPSKHRDKAMSAAIGGVVESDNCHSIGQVKTLRMMWMAIQRRRMVIVIERDSCFFVAVCVFSDPVAAIGGSSRMMTNEAVLDAHFQCDNRRWYIQCTTCPPSHSLADATGRASNQVWISVMVSSERGVHEGKRENKNRG